MLESVTDVEVQPKFMDKYSLIRGVTRITHENYNKKARASFIQHSFLGEKCTKHSNTYSIICQIFFRCLIHNMKY